MQSDPELLAEYITNRSPDAFAEIVNHHGAMVYRVAFHVIGKEADADDVSQAVFLVLARKAKDIQNSEKLAPWLYRVTRQISLKWLRSHKRRQIHEKAVARLGHCSQSGMPGKEMREKLDVIIQELEKLSPIEQQAIILRYLEGKSQEASAQIAGCPVGTLKRRASDGIAHLRKRLKKRGLL
jgi:RNA polymerase sigma-70 factor (ECF subfamily)